VNSSATDKRRVNFPPRNWALCDGQILPINQNQSLYSLLGTTYGGDGRTSFALPDLRGRSPIHVGNGDTLGSKSGQETVTLSAGQMPQHTHVLNARNDPATTGNVSNNVLARAGVNAYGALTAPVNMGSQSVANAGSGQGHENMQPYLAVNFAIALQGLFPSRN
jgi:microcystin-dependent protein